MRGQYHVASLRTLATTLEQYYTMIGRLLEVKRLVSHTIEHKPEIEPVLTILPEQLQAIYSQINRLEKKLHSENHDPQIIYRNIRHSFIEIQNLNILLTFVIAHLPNIYNIHIATLIEPILKDDINSATYLHECKHTYAIFNETINYFILLNEQLLFALNTCAKTESSTIHKKIRMAEQQHFLMAQAKERHDKQLVAKTEWERIANCLINELIELFYDFAQRPHQAQIKSIELFFNRENEFWTTPLIKIFKKKIIQNKQYFILTEQDIEKINYTKTPVDFLPIARQMFVEKAQQIQIHYAKTRKRKRIDSDTATLHRRKSQRLEQKPIIVTEQDTRPQSNFHFNIIENYSRTSQRHRNKNTTRYRPQSPPQQTYRKETKSCQWGCKEWMLLITFIFLNTVFPPLIIFTIGFLLGYYGCEAISRCYHCIFYSSTTPATYQQGYSSRATQRY